ncbi:hypothetical protein Tco_0281998 [Tanacetum coccineum]
MGNEHLSTILEKEESSVEDLVPIPSKSDDFSDIESECDVPDCDDSQTTNFSTFSNPFFDDSTSGDDESSHEETSNSTLKNDRFDTVSLSYLNHYSSLILWMDSSPKSDSSFDEFAWTFLSWIAPDFEASRARSFVIRSLELQSSSLLWKSNILILSTNVYL